MNCLIYLVHFHHDLNAVTYFCIKCFDSLDCYQVLILYLKKKIPVCSATAFSVLCLRGQVTFALVPTVALGLSQMAHDRCPQLLLPLVEERSLPQIKKKEKKVIPKFPNITVFPFGLPCFYS